MTERKLTDGTNVLVIEKEIVESDAGNLYINQSINQSINF